MTIGIVEATHGTPGSCACCGAELLQTMHGELCIDCLFRAGMSARADERVGPYELLQQLDAGGTGTVHIAKHIDHDGLVAVKLARSEILGSAEAVTAFRNGIRIQHALRDLSNIVSTYDLGTHGDGRPYVVMPLLDGGTLADRENVSRHADPEQAIEMMIKIARAVQLARLFVRDYFRGHQRIAQAGRREVYVARPFYSTRDEEPMLGMSTPLYADDKHIGMLIGRRRARATFGAVQMDCAGRGTCMTALLGPRDRDHKHRPMPASLYVLAAPGLAESEEYMVASELAQAICSQLECAPAHSNQFDRPSRPQPLVLDDYADPISQVRSMAALAPVGGTGLIVVVATPNSAIEALTERMAARLKAFLWVPVLLGCLLLLLVIAGPRLAQLGRPLRRRSRTPSRPRRSRSAHSSHGLR